MASRHQRPKGGAGEISPDRLQANPIDMAKIAKPDNADQIVKGGNMWETRIQYEPRSKPGVTELIARMKNRTQ